VSRRSRRRPRRGPEIRRKPDGPLTFGDMPAEQRVWIVDHIYGHVDEAHRDEPGRCDLDEQTVALLHAVKLAVCAEDYSERKVERADDAFLEGLAAVPVPQRDEANKRFVRWLQILGTMPAWATSPRDWFQAMGQRAGFDDPEVSDEEAAERLREAMTGIFRDDEETTA
jgi:hypothetical protein